MFHCLSVTVVFVICYLDRLADLTIMSECQREIISSYNVAILNNMSFSKCFIMVLVHRYNSAY